MAQFEKWEKYFILVMSLTLFIVILIVFVFIPGFTDYLISVGWYDKQIILLFIFLIVLGPFILVYIIILLIKRKK